MQQTIPDNHCRVKSSDERADAILRMLRAVAGEEQQRTFGQRLRYARLERGLEQAELAKEMHTSERTVSRLENDKAPPAHYLPILATIFPLRREWFLTDEELRGELLELRDKVDKLTELVVKHFGRDALEDGSE